ncbi:ATP cone domain-containing protein [Halopseudomonas pachastrellae]|nr:ATP cone domain-containing protein [Halopseudomonas pachastrellae]
MDMQTQSWPRWLNKRDDSRVAFDSSKIERAIERAGAATGELGAAQAHILTRAVLPLLPEGPELTVEQVQDCVERALMEPVTFPPPAPISSTANATGGCGGSGAAWRMWQPP